MSGADDTPEAVIESARRDIATVGRRMVLDRLGPSAATIAEETASRLLAHFDRLFAKAIPLLIVSKTAGGDSQIVYKMAFAMLEAAVEVAVAALAQGIDAGRFTKPQGTFQ